MDRAMLFDNLAMAERHISKGEHIIARQIELIQTLAKDGHPSEQAERLLRSFLETQAAHIADRDRILAALFEDT